MQDVRYALSTLERILADSGLDGAQKELVSGNYATSYVGSCNWSKLRQDPYFRTAVLQSTPVKECTTHIFWKAHTQETEEQIKWCFCIWHFFLRNLPGGRPFSAKNLISFPISWRRSLHPISPWQTQLTVGCFRSFLMRQVKDGQCLMTRLDILRCWDVEKGSTFLIPCGQKVTKQFRVECEKAKRDLLRETWRLNWCHAAMNKKCSIQLSNCCIPNCDCFLSPHVFDEPDRASISLGDIHHLTPYSQEIVRLKVYKEAACGLALKFLSLEHFHQLSSLFWVHVLLENVTIIQLACMGYGVIGHPWFEWLRSVGRIRNSWTPPASGRGWSVGVGVDAEIFLFDDFEVRQGSLWNRRKVRETRVAKTSWRRKSYFSKRCKLMLASQL